MNNEVHKTSLTVGHGFVSDHGVGNVSSIKSVAPQTTNTLLRGMSQSVGETEGEREQEREGEGGR